MKKWSFPDGINIEREKEKDSQVGRVKHQRLGLLANEICQSSLDRAINHDAPVVVVFEEKYVDAGEIFDRDALLYDILPKAKKTWPKDLATKKFLTKYEKTLLSDKIRVLRIGDYNTKGLEDEDWDGLLRAMAIRSDEDSDLEGLNLVKLAPFACSDLRMVFYNTRTLEGEEKSMGVTKFISFDGENIPEGMGYFGDEGKSPIREQSTFGFDRRTNPGRDIFIIGFNPEEESNWIRDIIEAILDKSWTDIYKNRLYIKVDDKVIEKDNLGEVIKNFGGSNLDEIKKYITLTEQIEKGEIMMVKRSKNTFPDDLAGIAWTLLGILAY